MSQPARTKCNNCGHPIVAVKYSALLRATTDHDRWHQDRPVAFEHDGPAPKGEQ